MRDEFLVLDQLQKTLDNRLWGNQRSWCVVLSNTYKQLLETKQFQQHFCKLDECDNVINYKSLNGDNYKFVLIPTINIDDIGIYLEV